MPVHGPKVESQCVAMCTRVEPFLGMGLLGKGQEISANFWQELATNHEAVSNYLVCLVAKLISLDSEHGLKPLVSVYRDLVELPVDHSKYKSWSSKPIPANARAPALELQHSIISTIYFLTEFYAYRPTIHLRNMYLRWNLARNYSGDGSRKLADVFEEKVITPFSVAQSKELIIHSPQSSLSLGEKEDMKYMCRLVDECCQNHRRALFGVLPPEISRICVYTAVSEALSYTQLQDALQSPLHSASPAIHHVIASLKKEAVHGQSQEQGDREGLLPLLQLLRDFITMMLPVDRSEAYQAIMAFYMWPTTHAECAKRVLDLLVQEGKVRGTNFRRKLLVENDLGLRLKKTEIRGQFVHMLVDASNPLSRGNQFSEAFLNRQDFTTTDSLYRMIIRNCFKSVHSTEKMVDLETRLRHLSLASLKSLCSECLELMEEGVGREEDGDEIQQYLAMEINRLHKRIIQEADTEEQRDSAVSCSSLNGGDQLTEESLSVFSLPSPHFPTYRLENCQYPTVLTRIREVLVGCQKQLSPETTVRTFSRSSRTSMDSTGSGHLEGEGGRGGGREEEGGGSEVVTNGHVEVVDGGEVGEGGEGGGEGEQEASVTDSRDDLVATPDSGHVMSPDPVTPPPREEVRIRRKQRSRSTADVVDTPSQDGSTSTEQNGDMNPNPTDEVFEKMGLVSKETSQENTEEVHTPQSSSQTFSSASTRRIGQMRQRSKSHKFIRRETVPANMYKRMSTVSGDSSSSSSSVIGPAPSYGTSRRIYTNVAGSPQVPLSISTIPIGSMQRVSSRRNTMTMTPKRRPVLAGAGSPLHSSMPKLRVLKIVLAGSDLLVCHAAKAYAYLIAEEPNLFVGLDVRFYHIPLSTASSADWQIPERIRTPASDCPEILSEQVNTCGFDVNIGRYMAHMDSWYERNVVLATHHTLRLLPGSHKQTSPPPEDQHIRPSLTPAKVLVDTVAHYCREANHCIRAKMYKLKVMQKSEKSHKIEHRDLHMLHRVDIQRLSGKRNNRQVKPFEANIQMTEFSLDGSFVRGDMMEVKDVWAVRACNIPRATDSTVPNPESECFELSVMRMRTSAKNRPMEESSHHAYELVLETRKDSTPLTVMVDGDGDVLLENVIRLELSPAYKDSPSFLLSGLKDARPERQLFFPLMTFWPVDL